MDREQGAEGVTDARGAVDTSTPETDAGTGGPTWYDVLGVDRGADAAQIRAAWREATDRATPGSSTFRSYNQAAETLLDPSRRRAYDASLPAEPSEREVVEPRPAGGADPASSREEAHDLHEPAASTPATEAAADVDRPYAPHGRRVLAAATDGVVVLAALLPLLAALVLLAVLAPAGFGETPTGVTVLVLAALVPVVVLLWNLVWRQGRSGQSLGKGLAGLELVRLGEAGPGLGVGRAFARFLLRALDVLPLLLGLLWPLWDRRRQTFSDKIVGTAVLERPAPAPAHDTDGRVAAPLARPVRPLVLAALALAAGAALALGVVAVREDGSSAPSYAEADQARVAAEDAAQAILSYDYRQLAEDQARAERYLTGDFRESYLENFAVLAEQPDGSEGAAVQTQAVVSAQVRSSGVTAVDEDGERARVLLFVDQTSERQGQQPQVFQNRVAVTMDRVGEQWLVSDLRSY